MKLYKVKFMVHCVSTAKSKVKVDPEWDAEKHVIEKNADKAIFKAKQKYDRLHVNKPVYDKEDKSWTVTYYRYTISVEEIAEIF